MAKAPQTFDPEDAFARKLIAELTGLYGDAKSKLDRILASGAVTDFQRFRAGELTKQVDAIERALDAYAVKYSNKLIPHAYREGAEFCREALKESGLDVDVVNMGNRVNARSVQAIATQMAADLVAADSSLGRDAKRIIRATQQKAINERNIQQAIARGILEGETRKQVSGRLAGELKAALGDGVKVAVNGRNFDPDYYAKLVARTMTRSAATEGTLNFGREYDIDLFQVSVHDNPCVEICAAIQGRVYSLSGLDPDFPPISEVGYPPYHPNCRHVLISYVPKNDKERAGLAKLSRSREPIADLEDYRARSTS